ncbi:MAG: sulfatase-like hydrolase/transferase [Burkholderiaceae bacterium]|nr:sulfatase-like hydrolase/transferase [Burkholderiaceae bacterium]
MGLLLIGVTCLLQPPWIWSIAPPVANYGSLLAYAFDLAITVGVFGLALMAPMLAALSSPSWKWLLFLLFAMSIVTNLVFYRVSGHTMTYTDWAILWQARANIGDALGEYSRTVLKATLATAPLLVGFLLVPVARRRIWPWALGVSVLSTGVFVATCVALQGGNTGLFPRSTSLYGMLVSTAFDRPSGEYVYATDHQPDAKPVAENIALVIDESISHDFFSEVVMPQIEASNSTWRVYDFGFASSMANCSMGSNIMLRKLVRADSVASDLYENPLVWSLARNAGFRTWLLDGQLGGFGHNLFDDVERSLIDHIPQAERTARDADLVDYLHAAWSGAPSFTLVIKKGAHFPYEQRYPAGYKADTPVLTAPHVQASERRAKYVNAVDYQTGGFFRRLKEVTPDARTVIFYTSDHGQNIADIPGRVHCNTSVTPHVNEGIVPLLVLANFDLSGMAEAAARNRNQMSHFDLAETLRAYLGYGSRHDAEKGLLRTAGDPVPGFVYKSPFGFFGRPVEILRVDRSAYLRMANERWGKAR